MALPSGNGFGKALRRLIGIDPLELAREIKADKARKKGSDKPTQVKRRISGGSGKNAGDALFEGADAG